jgi:hypothetical protein
MMQVTLEPHIADDGTVFAQWRVCVNGHLCGYLGQQENAPLNIIAINYDEETKQEIRRKCEALKGGPIPEAMAQVLTDEECEEYLEQVASEEEDDD